ncbi:type III restriction/modification enzyme restriction subunit [Nicoletella semolina]|uniref:Type III restriction/modification enzyme restriction subunit n=1 Tax=Nicoletella semolina TaxID=271160 RepID=A0A4R2N863_9PAST|nr:GIY-YIG nuclease family protein [Nicoletella semolina]MDH2923840.1 restriction endonuclease [Nicoletella semolina]TCP17152.1 type III restriction/modification enzyme restriction subunit [Nicoletella semolina]
MSEFISALRTPKIYVYTDSRFPNCVKVGYTTRNVEERVKEQYPVKLPNQSYQILLNEPAIRDDGSHFRDSDIHAILQKRGVERLDGEWFKCDLNEIKSAYLEAKTGQAVEKARIFAFGMRPEQQAAVEKTAAYFRSFVQDDKNREKTPHFLWNAKMRFGKTFAAYQLAKEMGWKKILVLTFKPAVQNAWQEDLQNHFDFQGWKFVTEANAWQSAVDFPQVCFGSFQDYLGKNKAGGVKLKNEWVHTINWDCIIFDEYHYGAWREKSKGLFEADEAKFQSQLQAEAAEMEMDLPDYFDEDTLPITSNHFLYLSGTPFRALNSGEFIEEQVYNWTYSDEQKAKKMWQGEDNPYLSLPRMVMLTYQLPDDIQEVALKGEFNEFDLGQFFEASGTGDKAKFKYENEVQKWLDLIRGALRSTTIDNLKLGAEKPPMPFADARLLGSLLHTLWFLPTVASCYAMRNLLAQKQNQFYHDYKVVVAAGNEAGMGADAIIPVKKAMGDPLKNKTITLSCGKLTTGVSVAPWTGIFMLRNLNSPETYFQAAFRVQTPWVLRGHNPNVPNNECIIKEDCYVFDFAPDRALKQLADYCIRLNTEDKNPEQKVAEFIQFLPVLAYDGSTMRSIDAAGILDMAMSGTTATLLARRWESALLVNVDNETLKNLRQNEKAMQALMSIEGFRSLNQDLETIINKSESVKKTKKEAGECNLTKEEKKQLTEDEKKEKSLRKQVQEKLIKFATRIPVFMYLSDYREYTLRDLITQLEPELFHKVTGLTQQDFSLLVSLNLFNSGMMNDAVYKFKRYEDSSLRYAGIMKYEEEQIGLYDTTISIKEYTAV